MTSKTLERIDQMAHASLAAMVPQPVADVLREEGRREILREIAKMEPGSPSDSYCTFCGALAQYHEPTCLWLRAQAAAVR